MDISEIEKAGEEVLDLLDKMADSIKPMIKEEFTREDPMLTAWNLIGGARVPIRNGIRAFGTAIKQMKGGDDEMGTDVV